MRRLILGWLLPLLLADQALKFYIKLNFTLGEKVDFIPGILELQFLENEGMAFGWALPGATGKLLLTSFRIIASVAIALTVPSTTLPLVYVPAPKLSKRPRSAALELSKDTSKESVALTPT